MHACSDVCVCRGAQEASVEQQVAGGGECHLSHAESMGSMGLELWVEGPFDD